MVDGQSNLIELCASRLAMTQDEVIAIARTAPQRYYVWKIEKRSGKGQRTLCHPSRELKTLQYFFIEEFLRKLPVHQSATAYAKGSSIKLNAERHKGSRVIIKLDFSNFFNSIITDNWLRYVQAHYPEWNKAELDFSCRILFWGNGSYQPHCLAVGAPSSPMMSNVLTYDIDVALSAFAQLNELVYTRYADDITFSSTKRIDLPSIVKHVKSVIENAKYVSLKLNEEKTILLSKKSSRRVTGLVITTQSRVSLGRNRKRLISSMVHRAISGSFPAEDRPKLAGLLSFAMDAEPTFVARLEEKYGHEKVHLVMCNTPASPQKSIEDA